MAQGRPRTFDTQLREDTMEKKPYTPPTITKHGDAVELTRGFGGKYWESFMSKAYSDFDLEPKD